MNDARLGIVRLELPDGRSLPLQLTNERLDQNGHGWVLERLEDVRRAKAGSTHAIADLLEVLTAGALTADEVMTAPTATYPLGLCTPAIWKAWDLAYFGPQGRPATDGAANPQIRRPTLLRRLFARP